MTRYQTICQQLKANPKRWLVTGGAGFIGSGIAQKLVELGQRVTVLDNLSTGQRKNLEPLRGKLELVVGDIRDLEICRQVMKGVDYVSHQAALGSVPRSLEEPLASHESNVNGQLNVLLAARDAGVSRVVYASSSSVYGDEPNLPKTEARIGKVLSPYAATKRINEIYAGVVQDCYGLENIGLRYFNVFGPRQDPNGPYAAVIPRWILRLLEQEPCEVFGDGTQSRDFCYLANAVQANLLAATAGSSATGRVYNIGCEERTNLNALYTMLRDSIARHDPAVANVQAEYKAPRPGDVAHSLASVELARSELGYEPEYLLAQGVDETVDSFVRAR